MKTIDRFLKARVELKVILGRTRMTLSEINDLEKGSIITLDKNTIDPGDLYINDKCIGSGEILVKNCKLTTRMTKEYQKDKQKDNYND